MTKEEREEAIGFLQRLIWYLDKNAPELQDGQGMRALKMSIDALEAQKSGKWERHYTRPGVYADLWFHATCCGYKLSFPTEYCPSCGAKMEVGE